MIQFRLKSIIAIFLTFLLIIPLNSIASDTGVLSNGEDNTVIDSYQYFTYNTMTNFLIELETNFSEIISIESFGETYEGREIWSVKLSDNVDLNEDEPGILLIGAHHGNEWPLPHEKRDCARKCRCL